MNTNPRIIFCATVLACLSGCYTQFATINLYGTGGQAGQQIVDSAAASADTIPAVDTATTRDGEICYWERDFFGRPVLRCRPQYYDDDWQRYDNYPWWYGDNSLFGENDCHCPYHSYYHPDCPYCWEYCYHNCSSGAYSHRRYDDGGPGQYGAYGGGASPSAGANQGGSGQTVQRPVGARRLVAGPRPKKLRRPLGSPTAQAPVAPAPAAPDVTLPPPTQSADGGAKGSPVSDTAAAAPSRQPNSRFGRDR